MASNSNARVAVITGGTSGIGLEFAERLMGSYTVVVCGRDEGRLQRARDKMPGILALRCDVTRLDDLQALVAEIEQRFGRLDLLVSNAGLSSELDFRSGVDADEIDQEVRLNLVAPIQLTNLALPLLQRAPNPSIVYVTSGYALAPATRAPVYSASKAGLRSFIKALRRQLKDDGIHVVEVVPPVVDTPAVAHRAVKKVSPAQVVVQTLKALGRKKKEVYVGQTRALPMLLRLAPAYAERLVARS